MIVSYETNPGKGLRIFILHPNAVRKVDMSTIEMIKYDCVGLLVIQYNSNVSHLRIFLFLIPFSAGMQINCQGQWMVESATSGERLAVLLETSAITPTYQHIKELTWEKSKPSMVEDCESTDRVN